MDLKALDEVPRMEDSETEREHLRKLTEYLQKQAEMLRYNLLLLEKKAENK